VTKQSTIEAGSAVAAAVKLASGFGWKDTHALLVDGKPNPSTKAGQDYNGITGAQIAAMVANPPCVDKEKAQWVIPSTYLHHDARDHEIQRQNGMFRMLVLDVDENDLSLDFLMETVQQVVGQGVSILAYSTKSSKPGDRRWRVIVPVQDPISGEDYPDTSRAFFDCLVDASKGELIPDRALSRVGQIFYLPNRGEFYEHRIVKASRLHLTAAHPITVRMMDTRDRLAVAKAEADARRAHKAAERAARGADLDAQPTEVFNDRHDVATLLARYGYKQDGQSNHWRSPYQKSGSYATQAHDGYWVSLSGSDADMGLGAASSNGNRYGDAFDLYVHFEHGGNFTKAVRAYAEEAGLTSKPTLVWPDKAPIDDLADFEVIPPPAQAVEYAPPALSEGDGEIQSITPAPVNAEEAALKEWVFLSGDNEFYNMQTGESMGVSAFNLAMLPITPMVEVEKADGGVTRKKLPASRTLIEHLDGHIAAHNMYRPDLKDRFFEVDGIPYVNAYLPHTVPDAATNWQTHTAWQICAGHITNILNGDGHLIIKWIAHNVQHPGRKILWSPIIVGVQGDGKTTLLKIMQAAMGRANASPVSPEAMFSDFTGWAEGACVKVLEEIRVHGNSRHNAMNKLKPLITNDSVEIVRKGKDGKLIANVTNYVALTNHMDALALDEGDRRWGVFKTRFPNRAAMLAELDDAYWSALHGAIDGHPKVIRAWLLSVDLTDFNRVVGPETNAHKRMMIEASRSPSEADICEALEIGGFGVCNQVAATDCINAVIQGFGGKPVNTSLIANIMRELGWAKFDQYLKWKGKNRRVYYRPELVAGMPPGADLARIFRTKLDATDEGYDADF
jgi:hypothetical protein